MTPTLRRNIRWGASVLAGGLLALAVPMYSFPFLAWIGLLPAIWAALDAETHKRSLLHGLVTGLVFSIPTFHWLLTSLRSFLGLSFPVALLVFLLLSLWLALPFVTTSLLVRLAHRRTRLPLTLIAPVALVASEFVLPSVVPWSLACTQAWVLPVLQLAELLGPLGILFCLGMVNGVVFDVLQAVWQARPLPRRPILGAAFTMLLVLGFGLVRTRQIDQRWAAAPKVKIGVVQSNIRADLRPQIYRSGPLPYATAEQLRQIGMRKHVWGSAQLQNQGAQLIVWPEAAFPFRLWHDEGRAGGAEFATRLSLRVPVVMGAITEDDQGRSWNSAMLLDRSGKITGSYDKRSLFLLGERVPLLKTFPALRKHLPPGVSLFEEGTSAVVFDFADASAPGGKFRLGPLICLEDMLPIQTAELSRQHPHALVAVGNDGWFGGGSEPWEHLALSVFRSVEQRTALVRAGQTGVSGFVDATGRVRSRLSPTDPPDAETIPVSRLIDDVAMLEAGHTFYATLGSLWGHLDLLGLLCLGLLAWMSARAGWLRSLRVSQALHLLDRSL